MATNFFKKKENIALLDSSFNFKENIIKVSKHETFIHFVAKCMLSYELMNNGHDIITEAIFENKKRADIFDVTEGVAYEVLASEKEENLVNKRKDYPVEVKGFKAKNVIEQSLKAFMR